MVFVKGSPKTRAAGRKGGLSGKNHFAKMPKRKLQELSRQAGIKSGETRRAKKAALEHKKQAKRTEKFVDKTMRTYYL